MSNAQAFEKVRIRDIFACLRDIFTENKNDINEEIIEQKLQEIYKVELELGVTDSINALEKDIENHQTSKKSIRSKKTSKMTTNRIITDVKNKQINKDVLNNENTLDR